MQAVTRFLFLGGLVLLLSACATPAPTPTPAPATPTGADRDAQGCIASAGYRWCGRTAQCERPWELAKKASIPNTAAAFDAYCAAPR